MLTQEHKQQIIERIMEVMLSPKTKPQYIVVLGKCLLEADRINLLAASSGGSGDETNEKQ